MSLCRKINGAGNMKFDMNDNGIINLYCNSLVGVCGPGTLG